MRLRVLATAAVLVLVWAGSAAALSGLRVKCDQEGAEIFLNGMPQGQCPKNLKVAPGKYQVQLKKELPDQSYYNYETNLSLVDGAVGTVEATLTLAYTEGYYYERVVKGRSLADCEAYLRKYPDGKYAGELKKIQGELAVELAMAAAGEFVTVPGGCFQMGDTFGDGDFDDKPVHEVCVDGFSIGKYEVTQGQWRKVMGSNPSEFQRGDNYPVEQVSWDDAQEFIKKLNQQSGRRYRLPTEAEWEYAARSGGKQEKYAGGDDVDAVAWYNLISDKSTHPVGQKQPNGLGIYDMSGNVEEWVQDYYHFYDSERQSNPGGPSSGHSRVTRGGAHGRWTVLAAARSGISPGYRFLGLGFRLLHPVQ